MKTDARDEHASQPPPNPRLEKSGGHHNDEPRIRIKVRGVADGEHRVDFLTDAAALDYEPFQDTVRVFGSLTKSGEQIHVQVGASALGHFDCTRCADPFERNIEVLLNLEFVSPRLERDPGDPNVHVYDPAESAYIDITDDVRDALALAIPMKHLCRKDCKGLCAVCGNNLNNSSCDHTGEEEKELRFPALKSLSERLRAEEKNSGRPN
jgi:uncharacterized protein